MTKSERTATIRTITKLIEKADDRILRIILEFVERVTS